MSTLLLLTSALQPSAEVLPGLALLGHQVRILPAEGSALLEAPDADLLLVDVRDPESYAAAHVPGAVALPLNELETGHGQLPQNAEIITYCT